MQRSYGRGIPYWVYILRCTVWGVHLATYSVGCASCDVQCGVYILRCTVWGVHLAMYSVGCTSCDIQCRGTGTLSLEATLTGHIMTSL